MTVILKGNEPGLAAYYHFWVKSDIPGTWTCAIVGSAC